LAQGCLWELNPLKKSTASWRLFPCMDPGVLEQWISRDPMTNVQAQCKNSTSACRVLPSFFRNKRCTQVQDIAGSSSRFAKGSMENFADAAHFFAHYIIGAYYIWPGPAAISSSSRSVEMHSTARCTSFSGCPLSSSYWVQTNPFGIKHFSITTVKRRVAMDAQNSSNSIKEELTRRQTSTEVKHEIWDC
jgi:hypothetical protein